MYPVRTSPGTIPDFPAAARSATTGSKDPGGLAALLDTSTWTAAFMTEIEHLLGIIEPLIRQYGLAVVPIMITLESLGAPLPGESLLIVASMTAERGNMSFPLLLLLAWVGGVIGDNIGYLIGRRLGRIALLRYGEKIGFTSQRLDQVEAVFARYGPFTVVCALGAHLGARRILSRRACFRDHQTLARCGRWRSNRHRHRPDRRPLLRVPAPARLSEARQIFARVLFQSIALLL